MPSGNNHRELRILMLVIGLLVSSPGLAPMVFAADGSSPGLGATQVHRNDLPPRLQWNENSGYCGEVSFISAGLYYGQYLSQYEARRTIARHVRQNLNELLIGVNDQYAAARMHLRAREWDSAKEKNAAQFLQWIKRQVVAGFPVAIGVYNNEYLLYGTSTPLAGDPTYDHIVPIIGIRSTDLSSGYASDDILIFSDNGLWGNLHDHPFIYRSSFGAIQGDRIQANAPTGALYRVPDTVPNYGVALLGIIDRQHETFPVRLKTNLNFERPEIKDGTNIEPTGRPLALTITVSGLQPGTSYVLYRYNHLKSVPNSDFNAHAANAFQRWPIRLTSGTTFTMKQTIDSNEVAVYRAVKAP